MTVDIDIGADVWTADGQRFGKVTAVVVDQDLQEATHIVIRRGFLFPTDVVVPIGSVGEVADHRVKLAISARQAADLPTLEASASEPLEVSDQDARGLGPPGEPNIWAGNPPLTLPRLLTTATNVQPYVVQYWRNVPEESLVLKEGLPVRARDGAPVGTVDELVADPATHAVTHLVVRRDGYLGHDKAIPVEWIERSDEQRGITLFASTKDIEELPDYH
jgi:sporulation protein YlmC with PRC-barrel domain